MAFKTFVKEQWKLLTMLLITGFGITVTAVIFKSNVLTVLPLYSSLIIMAMSARANRYAFIYSGVNSILYAVVNWKFGLIGQAATALLVSCPIQIVTFVHHHRRKYGNSTLFRRLSWKWRGLALLGFAVCWVCMLAVLELLGSSYAMLDTTLTLFGFLLPFLDMFAFIETPFLYIISSVVGIWQYVQMMLDGELARTPFLIYNVYSLICLVMCAFRQLALYREQRALKKEKEKEVHEGSIAEEN